MDPLITDIEAARATTGKTITATLTPAPLTTSVHGHGLALRNNDDGVPGLTQDAFAPGSQNGYDFKLPHPGTYWYHSHVEMQREQALYGALIVDDPHETHVDDKDWVAWTTATWTKAQWIREQWTKVAA